MSVLREIRSTAPLREGGQIVLLAAGLEIVMKDRDNGTSKPDSAMSLFKFLDSHAMMQNDRILEKIKRLRSIERKPVLHGPELLTVFSAWVDWRAAALMGGKVSKMFKSFRDEMRKGRKLASSKIRGYHHDLAGFERNLKKAQDVAILLGQTLKPLLVALDPNLGEGAALREVLCSEGKKEEHCL